MSNHNMHVRRMPRHVIVERLKRRGVRQQHIAAVAHVDQPTVSKVIGRRLRGTDVVERVWLAIEAALSGESKSPRRPRRRAANGDIAAAASQALMEALDREELRGAR